MYSPLMHIPVVLPGESEAVSVSNTTINLAVKLGVLFGSGTWGADSSLLPTSASCGGSRVVCSSF